MKVKNYSSHKNLKELKKVRGQIFFFSAIWDHLTRNNCEKNSRASCNYCGQSYASNSRKSGTSNL